MYLVASSVLRSPAPLREVSPPVLVEVSPPLDLETLRLAPDLHVAGDRCPCGAYHQPGPDQLVVAVEGAWPTVATTTGNTDAGILKIAFFTGEPAPGEPRRIILKDELAGLAGARMFVQNLTDGVLSRKSVTCYDARDLFALLSTRGQLDFLQVQGKTLNEACRVLARQLERFDDLQALHLRLNLNRPFSLVDIAESLSCIEQVSEEIDVIWYVGEVSNAGEAGVTALVSRSTI